MPPSRNRRRRYKRDPNFVAIEFSDALALGALADNTVKNVAVGPAFAEDIRIKSVDCLWTLRDATPGEGPITVGFAHSDYSITEIAEALNVAFTSQGSKIEKEQASRLVRKVGTFPVLAADEVLNNGVPIRTRLNWLINDGFELDAFAINRSGAIMTTGAIVTLPGTIYGTWKT